MVGCLSCADGPSTEWARASWLIVTRGLEVSVAVLCFTITWNGRLTCLQGDIQPSHFLFLIPHFLWTPQDSTIRQGCGYY